LPEPLDINTNPSDEVPTPNKYLEKPIYVFISSHQREFQTLRRTARDLVEVTTQGNRWLFKVDLAEDTPGLTIGGHIKELQDRTQIYVLFIGYRYSLKTEGEFDFAWTNGLPILVYEYYQSRSRFAGRVNTDKFMKKILCRDIIVRGHDKEDKYSQDRDVIDALINDLLEAIGRIVDDYTKIRKASGR
jgi:hypothetical protein